VDPAELPVAALNQRLLADCRRRFGDRLRGHDAMIGERLARDLACFHELPLSPYDACEKRPGRVSSLSLVRYRGTDYSVPTAYGYREVLIRGYVDTVVISCGADIIARHVRSYEREDFVFDPLHYLALLEAFMILRPRVRAGAAAAGSVRGRGCRGRRARCVRPRRDRL